MTLQRREGSMTRSPVGLLGGRQTRSSTGLKGGTTERLEQWLSRSASSIRSLPPPSSTHSLAASQVNTAESGKTVEHGRRLGRPTKASLLRMASCPVAYVQPDYREMVRRRKQFAQRSKSVSANAIPCGSLPNGESLHSFLTGARYNSSHHMDTRSLERLGLYIPRGDASRTFVNHAGTIPPSPAIYGLRHCSRGYRVSDTHALMHASSRHTVSDTGLYGCTLDAKLRQVVSSTVSIDKEIEQVFGPDQGSSDSDLLSLEAQFEGDLEGSDQQLAIDRCAKESGVSREKDKESVTSGGVSISNSNCSEITTSDVEGSQCFEVVTPVLCSKERKSSTDNGPTTSDPLTQISPSGTPKIDDEFESSEVAATKLETGDAQTSPEICLDARQAEDPESLDLISPTAQQIADDILKECQSSTSLSSSSSSTAGAANQRQWKGDGDIHTIDRCLQTSYVETSQLPGVSIRGVNLPLSGIGNYHHTDATSPPPSASSLQLASTSGKSSCIFVDLTSLQAVVDQDQD